MGKFSKRDSSEIIQPVRSVVPIQQHSGFLGVMPAYLAAEGILCTKMVTFYQRAEGSSLPSTQATVLLFHPEHGNVTAVSHTNLHIRCTSVHVWDLLNCYLGQ
uniref:Ketimine reductase mu-crystallin n=1 Tax=Sinocyclocheilus anshuiensis TaxID=1608454 RepID=A0A671MLI6_9TELE